MSEHVQSALSPQHVPSAATLPEHTPGVLHEKREFNLRLLLKVGLGLIVTAVVIHLAIWQLLVRQEIRHAPPLEGESSLALEDARRPLAQRLLDVPSPHLEGIERASSLLVLRTGPSKEQRFFVDPAIRVRIKDRPARLFELREGQPVTVLYYLPGDVAGGLGVATAVSTPPQNESEEATPHLPTSSQTITGTVVKVEPRSIEAARQWAEVQMERYGWADRKKEIARIPVADAMEEVLQSKEFRSSGRKKSDGRLAPPGRSNSGRGRQEDKP